MKIRKITYQTVQTPDFFPKPWPADHVVLKSSLSFWDCYIFSQRRPFGPPCSSGNDELTDTPKMEGCKHVFYDGMNIEHRTQNIEL
jgi:hypothetical protein